MRCLEDLDDQVRNTAMEALIAYPSEILSSLESSILDASPRGKQAILRIIRLSPRIGDLEINHFFGRHLVFYQCAVQFITTEDSALGFSWAVSSAANGNGAAP